MKLFNKTPLRAAIVVGLMLGASVSQPAIAQSSGPVVKGLAVATLDAVILSSNAFKTAEQQRQTTYKAQITQAEQRRNQISAQLQPLVNKFNTDRQAANPNQQALAQQAQQIQQIQQNGQEELQRIMAPVALSRAYVEEQIDDKLNDAVKAAMRKKNITLLLSPDAVLAVNDSAYNLNQDILNELNALIPNAQLVPPAGWEPRQIREARAQQQGAAAATTATQPQGR